MIIDGKQAEQTAIELYKKFTLELLFAACLLLESSLCLFAYNIYAYYCWVRISNEWMLVMGLAGKVPYAIWLTKLG